MKLRSSSCRNAFTLVELLISTAVCTMVMAGLLTAAISMQKCYAATEDYSKAKSDQLRLTDYLAMDIRRALTVTVGTGNTILVATIPNYYESVTAEDGTTSIQVRVPTIAGRVVNYGNPSTPVTVTYTKNGSSIVRQESGSNPVVIAEDVTDFKLTVEDLQKVVKTQIKFTPQFSRKASASAETATTVYNTTMRRNDRSGT